MHVYLMVPGFVGVNENVEPCPTLLDLKLAPDCAITLWSRLSLFVQTTFSPTLTVCEEGANWMFCMSMATVFPPLGDDDVVGVVDAGELDPPLELPLLLLLLPQPAATKAATAMSNVTKRLI